VDARAVRYLELGRIYAESGRIADALREYSKGLDSVDLSVRKSALAETKDLLGPKRRLWRTTKTWLASGLGVFATGIVTAVATGAAIMAGWMAAIVIGKIRRRLKLTPELEVRPLDSWSSPQTPYTHFREVIRFVREEMDTYGRLKNRVSNAPQMTVAPTISSNTILAELQLPVAALSEKGWPLVEWLARKLNPSDVVLEGSLTSEEATHHLVLKLVKQSKTLQMWDRTISKTTLAADLKDLAYAVLIWITRHRRT
jgi:hypothetical protein